MKRVILVVLDSVGIGELPDADIYGDAGSDTLGNIARAVRGLKLPNLEKLGLGNIHAISGVEPQTKPAGSYGKAAEASPGKDTTTGHWEISGHISDKPFPVYPKGFPPNIIRKFEKCIGLKTLGNYPASGTEIIQELGQQHVMTGYPIIYTSADSVFQIAAHEQIIPLTRLYEICRIAREILKGEHSVARIIARPFTGENGSFIRTPNRRDFSLEPQGRTILDALKAEGFEVKAVGKIDDTFAGRGITESNHALGNEACQAAVIEFMKQDFNGLVFANLVDFDMLFGHRNDPGGYAEALTAVDAWIPKLQSSMKDGDMAIITADHGCDPTTASTDHSREYIPILIFGNKVKKGVDLGVRSTFADIGATILDYFNLKNQVKGSSFLSNIIMN